MSISISVNGAQITREFEVVGKRAFNDVKAAVEDSAVETRDLWRQLATVSSGKHGKHYPKAIDYKMVPSFSAIVAEVAPDPSKRQGGMSFEEGSRNQPPHPDSVTTMTAMEPKIVKRIDRALGRAVG